MEINTFCARRLMQRQNEGHLSPFPIWDDVCTFDGHPWRGVVEVVSGGFPCQDISAAGKGNGIDGDRSGLWVEMARIIGEVRPRIAFVENSPMLTSRGLGTVLGDLAALGYDAEWGVLGAADVGAPHQRDRIWIAAYTAGIGRNERRAESTGQQRTTWLADGGHELADTNSQHDDGSRSESSEVCGKRQEKAELSGCKDMGNTLFGGFQGNNGRRAKTEFENGCPDMADANRQRLEELNLAAIADQARQHPRCFAEIGAAEWWATEPDVGRVAHGVAARVDRLQALGNGQVPLCHATACRRLLARIGF